MTDKPFVQIVEEHKIAESSLDLEGRLIPFSVISKSLKETLEIDLPYFISYNNGHPFISEEVPEYYRKPMIAHEFVEFTKYAGKENRCVDALKEELSYVPLLVPEDKREGYIPFRLEVFNHLLKYLNVNEPNSPFIPEVQKSVNYLKRLTQKT